MLNKIIGCVLLLEGNSSGTSHKGTQSCVPGRRCMEGWEDPYLERVRVVPKFVPTGAGSSWTTHRSLTRQTCCITEHKLRSYRAARLLLARHLL